MKVAARTRFFNLTQNLKLHPSTILGISTITLAQFKYFSKLAFGSWFREHFKVKTNRGCHNTDTRRRAFQVFYLQEKVHTSIYTDVWSRPPRSEYNIDQ